MARAELLKKLFASWSQRDAFKAIALQIIQEEERKNKLILASSLRKALDTGAGSNNAAPERRWPDVAGTLQTLPQEKDRGAPLVQHVHSVRRWSELVLSEQNDGLFDGIIEEYRAASLIRSHGLNVRSRMLFCGPPGCGKTTCAEVFANRVGLPLFVARLDVLVSSYLGETAANLRRIMDFAAHGPCVLLLDEFDAVGKSRDDDAEHGELKRVVNALLQLIDLYQGSGFIIAATNFEGNLDGALWRRFDEVILFDRPSHAEIRTLLAVKFKNFPADFDPMPKAELMVGFSHAEIERVCVNAIKQSIMQARTTVAAAAFDRAVQVEQRRRMMVEQVQTRTSSVH